ncbi:MAG: site-2 protease family protein [Oscillospiraceae bacterium]|nr:site-2 protease family protein [Oscillospiraceae bacterium]
MLVYILIALLLFGVLVAVHEFGHFATAKLLGVRVNEFAIGMGPALWKRQRGETQYSLRVFPVGGYCAMEGEDEESDDLRAFGVQPMWKRLIILCAGAFMNFLAGLLLILLLYAGAKTFVTPVISGFVDGFPLVGEQGLMAGDRIVSIDGERVYLASDVSLLLGRAGDTVDLVVERDGRKLKLNDLPLTLREYSVEGQPVKMYGLYFDTEEATILAKLRNSWLNAVDFVRLVRLSLIDLLSGSAGVKDLTGPIGIVDTIAQVGSQSATMAIAVQNILYFGALIAVNLAVMNLLPLPALDGGRVFFLLINALWQLIFGKKINPKYEGYVHFAGLLALLALMAVVAFNDLVRIFG